MPEWTPKTKKKEYVPKTRGTFTIKADKAVTSTTVARLNRLGVKSKKPYKATVNVARKISAQTKAQMNKKNDMEAQAVESYQEHIKRGFSNTGKASKKVIKDVKNAPKTIQKAKKTVKNIKTAGKMTSKAAQKSAQSARRAAQATKYAAKQAARVTVKAAKVIIKVVVQIVKVIVQAIVKIVAAIGAPAVIVIVIIVIIVAVVVALANSTPLGSLHSANQEQASAYRASATETLYTFQEAKTQLESELQQQVDTIVAEKEAEYPGLVVLSKDATVDNWRDVLSVYCALYWVGDSTDLSNMTAARMDQLRSVLIAMDVITVDLNGTKVTVVAATPTPIQSSAPVVVPTPGATQQDASTAAELTVDITSKTAQDMIATLAMTAEQQDLLYQMLAIDDATWTAYLGSAGTSSQSPVITGANGQSIVNICVSLLGTDYLWAGASDIGVDCSGLVVYAYEQVGIMGLPHYSNALTHSGHSVNRDDIQLGDIVCWDVRGSASTAEHVGIYVGNGKVIHASSTRDRVEYGNLDMYPIVAIRRILPDE